MLLKFFQTSSLFNLFDSDDKFEQGGSIIKGSVIVVKPHHSSRDEFNDLIKYLDKHSWLYDKSNAPNMELPYVNISTTNVSREEVAFLKNWLSKNSWDYLVDKFEQGGMVDVQNLLEEFDLDLLDPYEGMEYAQFAKSMDKKSALQIIINNVEGDYSQLSDGLAKIAEIQYPQWKHDEDANSENYAKGGFVGKGELVWRKLTQSERMKFLSENFTPQITPRTQEILVGKSYNFLPKSVKIKFESEYANKEEYAKGGIIGMYENVSIPSLGKSGVVVNIFTEDGKEMVAVELLNGKGIKIESSKVLKQ